MAKVELRHGTGLQQSADNVVGAGRHGQAEWGESGAVERAHSRAITQRLTHRHQITGRVRSREVR
jgi:hypothetical protein